MADVVVEGKVLRWGNSYGIRVRKADLEASDIHPGEEVVVRIEQQHGAIDLSDLPTFRSGRSGLSDQHDAALGQARSEKHLRDPEAGDEPNAGEQP